MAGATILGALDMDPTAVATFRDNFPEAAAHVYESPAEKIDPQEIADELGEIDLLLASPECTNHSCAKGNGQRSEDSRMTAFQVTRFADALKPRWIIVENVLQMASWPKYPTFLNALRRRGFKLREYKLNAADFSVPQSRRRLFIVCDRDTRPAEEIHRVSNSRLGAGSFVNLDGAFAFSSLRSPRRALATLERAKRARQQLGDRSPFLLVYYGSDAAGGWQRLNVPLRTVTTLDRFAVVKWEDNQEVMRMLQVPELKVAMGFEESFKLNFGTRRDKVRLLGNAVCPPLMKALVHGLLTR